MNCFAQKRLQAADRIFQIPRLATMGLRFDNNYKIIGYATIAELPDAATVTLVNMKGVKVTAQLHSRISFIDGLPART